DQVAPLALLFHRSAPLGSLVFSSVGNPGFISQTSDADNFQFQAPQDATLAVIVTQTGPEVLLTLEVVGETFPVVAPAPGEPVVLAPWQVDANGTLELRVKGDRTSTFILDVAINASLESLVGDTTDENSLDLTDSELAIGSGRLAVIGTSNPSTEEVRDADSEGNDTIATAIVTGIGIGRNEYLSAGEIGDNLVLADATKDVDLFSVDLLEGDVLNVDVIAESIASPLDAVLSIFDTDGQLLALVDDSNSSDPSIDFTAPKTGNYFVGISGFANLAYDPFLAGSGFGGSTGLYQIAMLLNGGGGATGGIVTIPDVDFYEVDWSNLAGSRVDVIFAGQNDVDLSSGLLEILGPDGETVLATASAQPLGVAAENIDLAITDFVVPTAGIYTLRFRSSTAGEYTLLVGEEIVFDLEPDVSIFGPNRLFSSSVTALGYLGPEPQIGGSSAESSATQSGGGGVASLIATGESEPNNTLAGATPLSLGFDGLEDPEVDVYAQLSSSGDVDYYALQLEPGDILNLAVDGAGQKVSLRNGSGTELISSTFNISAIYPATSPLLIDGNASVARVIDEAGVYYVGVTGSTGPYELNLRLFRPALEANPVGTRQSIFLDFDGETIDTSLFGNTASGILDPLSNFLAGWGFSASDESSLIDAIVATVEENLSTDVRAQGNNGDYAASGMPGEFDIEILNSRDHADPGNAEHVSRIVVGGTVDALGSSVIGLAQFIDPGNFETAGLAVVLLDALSSASNPNSLNSYELDPSTSMTDFVGVTVGNIVAHEAAHLFGAYHTERFNLLPTITDRGGNLDNFTGLVGEVWGDGDEIDVDLASDSFSFEEAFQGTQNSLNLVSYGLSTGMVGSPFLGPRILSVDPPAGINHATAVSTINVDFSETLDPIPANHSGSYLLFEAGPNGILEDGLADDLSIGLTPTYDGLQRVQLNIDVASAPLPAGSYRLVITDSILDLDGNPLNSKTGPLGGSSRLHEFEIFEIDPREDLYQLDLSVGESIVIRTATPFDDGAFPLTNDLDPELTIFDPSDVPLIADADSRDGKNAELSFDVVRTWTYSILVSPTVGAGEYILEIDVSLLGNFNGDNLVNGADFLQWQRSFGQIVAPVGTGADGNSDGVVDESDFQLWQAYYGISSQFSALEAGALQFARAESLPDQAVDPGLQGGSLAPRVEGKPTQHAVPPVQLDARFQWLGGLADLSQDRWSDRMSLEFDEPFVANRTDSHHPAFDQAFHRSHSSMPEISRTGGNSRRYRDRLDQIWSDWQPSSRDDDAMAADHAWQKDDVWIEIEDNAWIGLK
ncbi:MAG: pre-peptidase C-terminal domain-containing protein, partial [Bythopirellula sp.]